MADAAAADHEPATAPEGAENGAPAAVPAAAEPAAAAAPAAVPAAAEPAAAAAAATPAEADAADALASQLASVDISKLDPTLTSGDLIVRQAGKPEAGECSVAPVKSFSALPLNAQIKSSVAALGWQTMCVVSMAHAPRKHARTDLDRRPGPRFSKLASRSF